MSDKPESWMQQAGAMFKAWSDQQRTVWKGVNKNNIRFGINFGFARGVEIEDEVWDDEPPVKKPAKPDDAAPPKNGPVQKAAAKR